MPKFDGVRKQKKKTQQNIKCALQNSMNDYFTFGCIDVNKANEKKNN